MRFFPASCTSNSLNAVDPPHATMSFRPSTNIVPVSALKDFSSRAAEYIFSTVSLPPGNVSIAHAPGTGLSPRMKSYTCLAGFVQSMRHVYLNIFGADLSCSPEVIISCCDMASGCPSEAMIFSIVRRQISAPRRISPS